MQRRFNITGACDPKRHYMVDISHRLDTACQMVDRGDYFSINRARQYGKTTMLQALSTRLRADYLVVATSFQKYSSAVFADEKAFAQTFAQDFDALVRAQEDLEPLGTCDGLTDLFVRLSATCAQASKPLVLIIDEVDQASNNQVFLDFLGQLREYYLTRETTPTFQSVILAGVYDIRNLRVKIRPDEQHRYNSPWNIAEQFDVDMGFSAADIAGMLHEYQAEHPEIPLDAGQLSQAIFEYTGGYPYLVSAICKMLDERTHDWSAGGVSDAVGVLLRAPNTLFDDLVKQINEYPDLQQMLRSMLFNGASYPYNYYNQSMNLGTMFGYLVDAGGNAMVANRIFETFLYNYFISEDLTSKADDRLETPEKGQFIRDGKLDMEHVLEKFVEYFEDVFGDAEDAFVEENGRRLFLLYLKPIINGTGNYYIEARTRNLRRTDIVIDYAGEQYIVELKIWRGEKYREHGERQLADYLHSYHQAKGYLLSFNFNRGKQPGIQKIAYDDCTIVEAMV